jgi:hypothetical protein
VNILRFPHQTNLLQQIRLEAKANKNFVLQNLNENQDFFIANCFKFIFSRVISHFPQAMFDHAKR